MFHNNDISESNYEHCFLFSFNVREASARNTVEHKIVNEII